MSWRLGVRHTTGHQYPREVQASFNEVRVSPASTLNQITLETRLEISPSVHPFGYIDYWGTIVHSFDVHEPHTELRVTATSVVDTPTAHTPDDGLGATWSMLDEERVRDRFHEYLTPTPTTVVDDDLREVADAIRHGSATPREALDRAMTWVHDALSYEKGSTDVSTVAVEAWHAGRGVCQDFVHLSLALLRAAGVPGRYVSGYLHPRRDAEVGATVEGESHAWAEAWLGDWVAFDPTNTAPVAERHVLVARGRDYGDVTPMKGVYSGAPSSTHAVLVELTRLHPTRHEGWELFE